MCWRKRPTMFILVLLQQVWFSAALSNAGLPKTRLSGRAVHWGSAAVVLGAVALLRDALLYEF